MAHWVGYTLYKPLRGQDMGLFWWQFKFLFIKNKEVLKLIRNLLGDNKYKCHQNSATSRSLNVAIHYATFRATVGRNQSNSELSEWVLIGSHQRLLQTVAWCL